MWKGIAIGVALVVESALCAGAQTPDQSEETKRRLSRQFLDCVTSQVITIDDFTSDVSAICAWRGLAMQGCHAAAVSNAGSQTGAQLLRKSSLEASGVETGVAALLKSRAAMRKRPVPRATAAPKAKRKGAQKLDGGPPSPLIVQMMPARYGFRRQRPTVGAVPHFAPSGAPPLGQKTETNVSLASQLTEPSACTDRIAGPPAPTSPFSPGAP
jgi:hypothetical protein